MFAQVIESELVGQAAVVNLFKQVDTFILGLKLRGLGVASQRTKEEEAKIFTPDGTIDFVKLAKHMCLSGKEEDVLKFKLQVFVDYLKD